MTNCADEITEALGETLCSGQCECTELQNELAAKDERIKELWRERDEAEYMHMAWMLEIRATANEALAGTREHADALHGIAECALSEIARYGGRERMDELKTAGHSQYGPSRLMEHEVCEACGARGYPGEWVADADMPHVRYCGPCAERLRWRATVAHDSEVTTDA